MTASDWAWRATAREHREQERTEDRLTFVFRCTRKDKAAMQRAAERAGLSLFEWIKRTLIEQARAEQARATAEGGCAPSACPDCRQPLPRCECPEGEA